MIRPSPALVLGMLVALAVSSMGSIATAQPVARRLALVDPGDELDRAARASLEPWNVEIVVVPPPSPGATMPGTSEAARAVAVAHRAAAVVWISEHVDGFALWVYDVETDQVSARRLMTPPPFDAPSAAGVALSIKTLLRHSAVAPVEERFGSSPTTDDDALAATRASASGESPQEPREQEEGGEDTHSVDDATSESASSRYDLEGRGAARFDRTQPSTVELRLGLGFIWWPGSDLAGVALRVVSGPGVQIDHELFRGRLIDTELTIAGALRWTFEDVLRLSATGGVSAHIAVVDGTILADGQAAEAVRVDPSLDVEVGVDWVVTPWIRLGVRGGMSWLLLTQRYQVHGNTVLTLSPVAFEAGLTVGAMLPD